MIGVSPSKRGSSVSTSISLPVATYSRVGTSPSLFLHMDAGNICAPFWVDGFRFKITFQDIHFVIWDTAMIGMVVVIVKDYWKKVFNRRIFFQLKNRYSEFKDYIKSYIGNSLYIFLYRLNHGAFFIFVIGKDNDIFFTCQSMINIDHVREDILEGYYKRVAFDANCVDGIFCRNPNEWRAFYNIVLYASEIKDGSGSQMVTSNALAIIRSSASQTCRWFFSILEMINGVMSSIPMNWSFFARSSCVMGGF